MLARRAAYARRECLDAGPPRRATPGAALALRLNRPWRRLASYQADKCARPTPLTVHWSACATYWANGPPREGAKARRWLGIWFVLGIGQRRAAVTGRRLTDETVPHGRRMTSCWRRSVGMRCVGHHGLRPAAPWREVRAALLPGPAQAVLNRSRRSRGITRTAEGWPGFSSCIEGKTNTHLTQLLGDLIFWGCELIFHARRLRRVWGAVSRVCWGAWRAPGLISAVLALMAGKRQG